MSVYTCRSLVAASRTGPLSVRLEFFSRIEVTSPSSTQHNSGYISMSPANQEESIGHSLAGQRRMKSIAWFVGMLGLAGMMFGLWADDHPQFVQQFGVSWQVAARIPWMGFATLMFLIATVGFVSTLVLGPRCPSCDTPVRTLKGHSNYCSNCGLALS